MLAKGLESRHANYICELEQNSHMVTSAVLPYYYGMKAENFNKNAPCS